MSITTLADRSFEATATGAPTGLTGTLGVRILDGIGGTTVARTTSGIVETPAGSGTYVATLTAPSEVGQYLVSVKWGTASDRQLGCRQPRSGVRWRSCRR